MTLSILRIYKVYMTFALNIFKVESKEGKTEKSVSLMRKLNCKDWKVL